MKITRAHNLYQEYPEVNDEMHERYTNAYEIKELKKELEKMRKKYMASIVIRNRMEALWQEAREHCSTMDNSIVELANESDKLSHDLDNLKSSHVQLKGELIDANVNVQIFKELSENRATTIDGIRHENEMLNLDVEELKTILKGAMAFIEQHKGEISGSDSTMIYVAIKHAYNSYNEKQEVQKAIPVDHNGDEIEELDEKDAVEGLEQLFEEDKE